MLGFTSSKHNITSEYVYKFLFVSVEIYVHQGIIKVFEEPIDSTVTSLVYCMPYTGLLVGNVSLFWKLYQFCSVICPKNNLLRRHIYTGSGSRRIYLRCR